MSVFSFLLGVTVGVLAAVGLSIIIAGAWYDELRNGWDKDE